MTRASHSSRREELRRDSVDHDAHHTTSSRRTRAGFGERSTFIVPTRVIGPEGRHGRWWPPSSVRTSRCIRYSDASFRSRVARQTHQRDEPTTTVFSCPDEEDFARLDNERKSSPGLTRFMSQAGQFDVKTVPRAPARVCWSCPSLAAARWCGGRADETHFETARPRRADTDKSAFALWRAAETSRVRTRGTTRGSLVPVFGRPPGRLRLR